MHSTTQLQQQRHGDQGFSRPKPSVSRYFPTSKPPSHQRSKPPSDFNSFSKELLIPVSQEFTYFPSLPTELRLKIWQYAQPGRRLLSIERGIDEEHEPSLCRFYVNNPHPTLLAVNREARYETLKLYAMIHWKGGFSLAFNSQRDIIHDRISDCHGKLMYPFWIEDIPGLERLTVSKRSLRIRSIAVDERIIGGMKKQSEELKEWVDLDEIFIVLSPSGGLHWSYDLCVAAREERVLEAAAEVEEREGWGNAVVLNTFMRGLEEARRKLAPMYGPVLDKDGRFRIPTVKVVQWSWTDAGRRDSFCVPLTPLSLRKWH